MLIKKGVPFGSPFFIFISLDDALFIALSTINFLPLCILFHRPLQMLRSIHY
jgi:hypothetical protein